MWAVLSAVLVMAFIGIAAIEHDQSTATPAANVAPATTSIGQDFMMYRNAVVAYAETNASAGASGNFSVAAASMTFPPGLSSEDVPAGADNLITPGAGGARIVYVWAPAPSGTVAQTVAAMDGDLSIGRITGANWSTPSLGTMGAIPEPGAMPSGDMISVVQLGG